MEGEWEAQENRAIWHNGKSKCVSSENIGCTTRRKPIGEKGRETKSVPVFRRGSRLRAVAMFCNIMVCCML